MIENKKTYYLLILDKSGSMESIANKTVAGYNEQVQMIKELQNKYPGQEIFVSLTTFNHQVDFDLLITKPHKLKQMYTNEGNQDYNGKQYYSVLRGDSILYKPGGMTALYDAIGMSVKKLRKKVKHELKNNEASAVVVIITDGHENSSRKYSYDDIKKLIGKLEKHHNWTFSYLGATPDAVDIAKGLNIDKDNAMYFNIEKVDDVMGDNLPLSMDDYMEEKSKGIIKKKYFKTSQ